MTAVDLELLEGEQLMSDGGELAYRQTTKHMFDDGKLATTAFGPMRADTGMPSFSRSSLVTAQDARDWHTRNAKSPSLGVWAVTVGEVVESERYVVDDSKSPLTDGEERAPGHCFVDYRGLTKAQQRELRTKLYFRAIDRGEVPTEATPAEGQLFA
jgi:hypothetical protein